MTDTEQERLDKARNLFFERTASVSLRSYLEQVLIDGSAGPVRFAEAAEPWQRRSLMPIMAACEYAAHLTDSYSGPRLFWRDLPQGHDKTSGIARILNGALAFSKKPVRIGVFARDKDQAHRIHDFMRDEARLNPWFAHRIQFIQNRARGINGSTLEIYDADSAGNAGHKLDIAICEELTWWADKGKHLFDQLFTRRTKIVRSVIVVLGNAGITGTWQHKLKQEAEKSSEWDYYRTEGTVAGWIDAKQLARDRHQVSPAIARRVFDNEWISPEESGYMRRSELDAVEEESARLGLVPEYKARPNVRYVVAIDYASRKDRCAMGVVGAWPDGTVRLVRCDVLRASDFPSGVIPLKLVEEWAAEVHVAYHAPHFVVDPYQMEWFCQLYEHTWKVYRYEYRGGMTNYRMAVQVRTLLLNKLLLWPKYLGSLEIEDITGEKVIHTLADEFVELVTRQMPYGFRWDHLANKFDDRATMLGMAAYYVTQIDTARPFGDGRDAPSIARAEEATHLTPIRDWSLWGPSQEQ